MSCPVNLQALPSGVFEAVFTPENVRGRSSVTSVTPLSFPRSRSALWDGTPAGKKLRLQLGSHRKPQLVLVEKALRLAQRHARHTNKPRLHCFFLGSVSVDTDEEGVTVTLDRFDPGRDQPGASGRVPSALLPGDVLVPCLFSTQTEASSDEVVQSESDLHHCFKVLQQSVSSRQSLHLSQVMKVRGRVVCSQQLDATSFSLSWSSVCPLVSVDVQPVQSLPVIPTALLRTLTGSGRPYASSRQRGFLTMDQTRKLLLLLESDPKASSLPLVGLWLSGVTHVHNPQVWTWCLRYLFGSALQDRVFSESCCFLLVLFSSTHRVPQFFQCQGPGPGRGLDYQLLTASQCVTLYQVESVEGQSLQCELGSEDHSRQMEVFRKVQSSFKRAAPPAAGLSASDQDSGVEDEDLSPRPSPSPHLPAAQTRRVQPSVPELSLLIDGSFTANHNGSAPRAPAAADRKSAPSAGHTSSVPRSPPHPPPHHSTPNSNLQQPCSCCSTFTSPVLHPNAVPPAASSHHHTCPPSSLHPSPAPPSSNLPTSPPSTCGTPPSTHQHTPLSVSNHPPPPSGPSSPLCSHPSTPPPLPSVLHPAPPGPFSLPVPRCGGSHVPSHSAAEDPAPPPWFPQPPFMNQCCDQMGGVLSTDAYQLLLQQDRQLRLLQAQVQMLLEAQGKLQSSSQQVETPRSTASVAVGTGASLLWADPVQPLPHQEVQAPPPVSSPTPPPSSSPSNSSCNRPPSHTDLSVIGSVGGAQDGDVTGQESVASPRHSALQSPVLGESVSMYGPADDPQNFYQDLMSQLTSRLQESDSRQEVEEEGSRRRSLSAAPDRSSQPSSSSGGRQQRCRDPVVSATLRQLQRLGVDVDDGDLTESDRRIQQTVESSSTLASINPAAVVSRLSVSEPTVSSLFPGSSVDLSLEANAIALRYLSDSQLSRLSLGGHAPRPGPASPSQSLLSPSNMSVATKKYMRKYGLIEEEDEEEEADVSEVSARQPLVEAQNVKLLPQSQLIRDLRPKMQLLAGGAKPDSADKENCSSRRPSLLRASSRQTEGSVGNILDLSRLRQLPKLF